ncbi:short-chain dehydrogenase [Haloprofundus marisrubri]|uniref:Short-chain dehydrogenase n=1 Tax=Haloprofundus marisrubri TaxID=1514971 RepID=A0A0W1RBG5_9EURY|nr:SDR family NAD(P)-dependent oxidoreductase [Haloprofundus marisrubri]KTG10386.1 short-chain dehydrogenase [Haloprofundus marisrubri]
MADEKRCIVVGASSGIGAALARRFAAAGYTLGLAARRTDRLVELGEELPTKSYVARIDVTDPDSARERFDRLADAMGGVDVVVVNAGVAFENPELAWNDERTTVDTNVRGFVAIATAAMAQFEAAGGGHLVGISSVAAHFGSGVSPAYSASKAFVSNYLDGLRYRARRLDFPLSVTTIEPGFVDTKLAGGSFWMASPETAADQIFHAVRKQRRRAYVTRRWRLVALLIDALPDIVRRRVFS